MAEPHTNRRLAAILASDVAGYSRLMGADEEGTLGSLTGHRREHFDPCIVKHRGRIVKTTGDGLLAEFASVVDAVRCAIEVQTGMAERNAKVADDRRLMFRIGINVGDIIEQDGDVFGDGVNIAARLEGIAEPGGICVSQRVQEDAAGKTDFVFEDGGERALKNIARPVHVYHVRAPRGPERPGATTVSLSDKPAIAVLPFQNMSGDEEQEYFADGITEDIITGLSRLRWFMVISRNSTFAYKGKATDVRQLARDLGVRYVLEGSVRKASERMRVTSQLIDATNGAHVWAEKYDRNVADVFAVQDEITGSVVAAIEPQLYAAESLRFVNRSPDSLDAWGHVVRAMPYVWSWGAKDNETALMLAQRALAIDPNYGKALAISGWCHACRAHFGWAERESSLATALLLAQQAVTQDFQEPWAHLALGYVQMIRREPQAALEEFGHAVGLNPSFAFGHALMGNACGYAGHGEEGLRHVNVAIQLSPRDPLLGAYMSIAGLNYLILRRFEEAVEHQRRAVQLRPNLVTAWRTLAATAGLAGDLELAKSALAELKRVHPDITRAWVEKNYPLVRSEDMAMYLDGLAKAGLD